MERETQIRRDKVEVAAHPSLSQLYRKINASEYDMSKGDIRGYGFCCAFRPMWEEHPQNFDLGLDEIVGKLKRTFAERDGIWLSDQQLQDVRRACEEAIRVAGVESLADKILEVNSLRQERKAAFITMGAAMKGNDFVGSIESKLQQADAIFQELQKAREFLHRYQQRYHGVGHAKELWNEVDAFLNPPTDAFP